MMYLYKEHVTGLYYVTRYRISDEDLECFMCGDKDIRLGTFTTDEEKEQLIKTYEKLRRGI